MRRIWISILLFMRDRFNLSHEQADKIDTIKSIEKGVAFRGVNIWTLIFAIFLASVGLNVNSTAVIIGAMLISPLMGPIMGLGLSVGIYDFQLLKKSLENLVIAVIISVITSAIYFGISPLSEAQSELLSRTTPTIYDVLIAFFGGLSGIVAGATKEKGNAIPGVAIATALMPPLCTAGYGLAKGNWMFFLGAFYLFFINAVMISLSTLLIVRFLKFPLKQNIDINYSKKVKKYIYVIVVLTVLPSIYFAFHIVEETIFKSNAMNYVKKEFNFNQTQVLKSAYKYNQNDSNMIEVMLIGKQLEKDEINKLKAKLKDYSLQNAKLVIRQGIETTQNIDMNQIKSGIIDELYHKNEINLENKDKRIKFLENEIEGLNAVRFPVKDLTYEISAINNKIYSCSANQMIYYDINEADFDTTIAVSLKTKSRLKSSEITMLHNWLEKRLKFDHIKLITG